MRMKTSTIAICVRRAASILGIALMGQACGGDPIYSAECRQLADSLNADIDSLAGQYKECAVDADCALAVAVVPCNRDLVRAEVVANSLVSEFRAKVEELSSQRCSAQTIKDCNAHCGTTGSLVFPVPGVQCQKNKCEAVGTSSAVGASLSSQELCSPQKYVYEKDELGL